MFKTRMSFHHSIITTCPLFALMLVAVLLPVASGIRTLYLHFENAILEDILNIRPGFLFLKHLLILFISRIKTQTPTINISISWQI